MALLETKLELHRELSYGRAILALFFSQCNRIRQYRNMGNTYNQYPAGEPLAIKIYHITSATGAGNDSIVSVKGI